MIALRGVFRQLDDHEIASLRATPNKPGIIAETPPPGPRRWVWEGLWSFASLPDDILSTYDKTSQEHLHSNVKPFVYMWQEKRRAQDVQVPSLNAGPPEDEEEEEEGEDYPEQEKEKLEKSDKVPETATSKGSEADSGKDSMQVDDKKETKEDNNDKMEVDEPEKEVKELNTLTKDTEDSKEKPMSDAPGTGGEGTGVKDAAAPSATKASDKDVKEEEKSEFVANIKEEEKDEIAVSTKNKGKDETVQVGVKEEQGAPPSADKQQEKPSEKSLEAAPPEEQKEPVTFATTFANDALPYTEASTKHDKCPPDGAWTGHFENTGKRYNSRVPEDFSIFFNATPEKDASVLFADESADKSEASSTPKKLPEGHIHVRGTGRNQFGYFELIGGFNLETGIVDCHKMYVRAPSRPKKKTKKSPTSISTPASTSSRTPRSSQGRKRQMSWRKRESLNDEDEMARVRILNSTKKRSRSNSSLNLTSAAASLSLPTATPTPAAASVPRPRGVTPAPAPRKRSWQTPKSAVTPTAASSPASSSATTLKLPLAGDPNDARWRACHYLYYQRNDPSESSPATEASPSFVVYEGEMLQGERSGRGVCLYNNGTLYEGEWKRNKEHGRGSLWTADRKNKIYEGEWERGRMHGKGVYYYNDIMFSPSLHRSGSSATRSTTSHKSRYQGEFKENARHGVGTYHLPDGSMYQGEFRENLMNGRGTFTFEDGSIYDGQWKDGQRHGPGMLHASDGFTYDGMWVQNAMEGRGIATYPSGQRYEGLWTAGRREGRGTIHFTNGAVYEGRFRDDCMEGQGGTMKMTKNAMVQRREGPKEASEASDEEKVEEESTSNQKQDWMVPISFQSDMGHIHRKAGFTVGGE